jgi:hypothetical protein
MGIGLRGQERTFGLDWIGIGGLWFKIRRMHGLLDVDVCRNGIVNHL